MLHGANFYVWGAGKTKVTHRPEMGKKVSGVVRTLVVGETYCLALQDSGQVVAWGKEQRFGCLGLGKSANGQPINNPTPLPISQLSNIVDLQKGQDHIVALSGTGSVHCWGRNDCGQLGKKDNFENSCVPSLVSGLSGERVIQIAVTQNATYALAATGAVYAWGDNSENAIGIDDASRTIVDSATKLTTLDAPIRRLEVVDKGTVVAHLRNVGRTDDSWDAGSKDSEEHLLNSVGAVKKAMEEAKGWWNDLISLKHGHPYDLPDDEVGFKHVNADPSAPGKSSGSISEDRLVDPERLKLAKKHLNSLLHQAFEQYEASAHLAGSNNVKFILRMFIDCCRLRREKVMRLISARQLQDAKQRTRQVTAPVADFGSSSSEDIRKIVAVTRELQQMLEVVKHIPTGHDMPTEQLKLTLIECVECKQQVYEMRLEKHKEDNGQPHDDSMLSALRIINDRWNSLKHFSVHKLWSSCQENERLDFGGDDNKQLAYLVEASNAQIDQMLQLDKDNLISHDTLVPKLCYDLLRENAELRKMANSYQLHVLTLHMRRQMRS